MKINISLRLLTESAVNFQKFLFVNGTLPCPTYRTQYCKYMTSIIYCKTHLLLLWMTTFLFKDWLRSTGHAEWSSQGETRGRRHFSTQVNLYITEQFITVLRIRSIFSRIRIRGSGFQNPDLDPGDPKRLDPTGSGSGSYLVYFLYLAK